MPFERIPLDMGYLIHEYRSGRSMNDLARELGVSYHTVSNRLREAGFAPTSPLAGRTVPERRLSLPDEEIIVAYHAGTSVKALSEQFGVNRGVILKRLRERGVTLRDQTAANQLMAQQRSPEENRRITAAAHAAARGRKHSPEERAKMALSRQRNPSNVSPDELRLTQMLQARGIDVVQQQAIGPYNCDIGAAPVAVEIFGGAWHWHGRHLLRTPDRCRYLLNAGWHLLAVKVEAKSFPLTEATADYVAAYIQYTRRNPTIPREYRVIRGAGELLVAGRANDDEITLIPTLRGRKYVVSGNWDFPR